MAKQLENNDDADLFPTDFMQANPPSMYDGIDDDIDTSLFGTDEDDEDEDTDGNEEVEEEDEPEETDDDEEDEEDEPPVRKKTTSAERRIIELKRLLKEEKQKNKLAETQGQQAATASQLETTAQTYIDQGFDEDTAKRYAEYDNMKSRLAIIDFRDENSDILDQYPGSRKNASKIMKAVEATGMDVEDVCKLLHGKASMTPEQRAEAKARGQLPKTPKGDRASSALRASRTAPSVRLTEKDLKNKKGLERFNGEKLTNEEYLALKKQFKL